MDDTSLLGPGRARHRHHQVAAAALDQPQRADRQLDPDRRIRPGADQRIAPCTTLGRPLVRVWPAGATGARLEIGCLMEEDRKIPVDSGLRPPLPRTHKTNSLKGAPRAPDGWLEQTGSPELIPGPRIRS
jgi:hypothetical protein